MTATTLSGTCGDVPSSLIASDVTPGCVVTSDAWSADQCQDARTLTCTNPDGSTTKGTGVTTQVTDDGSVIEGTVTLTVTLRDGESCVGTYNVSYVRQ